MPQIEVTFDIDANGILNVTAKDMATGKDQKITITSSSGLSKEEVDRMAKDADAHSDEDKKRREEIEARNQLDSLVYSVEKMLREHGDKISGSERGDVENALADAKKALEGGDKAAMDQAREKLTSTSHKLAEAMYRAAQPAAGAQPGAQPGPEAGAGALRTAATAKPRRPMAASSTPSTWTWRRRNKAVPEPDPFTWRTPLGGAGLQPCIMAAVVAFGFAAEGQRAASEYLGLKPTILEAA